MKPLAKIGYDPGHRMKAMALAQTYGRELYTGVLYRDPDPPPTYDSLVRERQQRLPRAGARAARAHPRPASAQRSRAAEEGDA